MRQGQGKAWLALTVVFTAAALAGANEARTPITVAQVSKALAAAGLTGNPERVEMLSSMSSLEPHAALRVASVEPMAVGDVRVRLRCERNSICLPFYVVVHNATGKIEPAIRQERLPMMVHGGDHVMLICEGKGVQITLPVICLQNGVAGQQVRVRSTDRKKTYLARVVRPGLVSAQLAN